VIGPLLSLRGLQWAQAFALAAFCIAGCAAQIVVLSSGDTYITQHPDIPNAATTNFGTATSLLAIGPLDGNAVYVATPLISFDLSAYAGRTVSGDGVFSIWLNSGIPRDDGIARPMSVQSILVPWSSATVTFANFGPEFGIQSTDVSGGLSTASVTWPDSGAGYVNFTIPAATLQQWLDTPSSNNGLLVRNDYPRGGDLSFSSLEAGTGVAPKLAFNLQAVPEPSTWTLLVVGTAVLTVATTTRRRNVQPST
jgi:hypothetical protein